MRSARQLRWAASAVVAGIALAGCGTVAAKSPAAASTATSTHVPMATKSKSMPKTTTTGFLLGGSGDVLVGAAASPAMGSGNGMLLVDSVAAKHSWKIPLAQGANAFQVAVDHQSIFVPTLQGKTYVVSLRSHQVVSTFKSPVGARIATLAAQAHLLLVMGANNVTAYSLPSLKPRWQANVGGNALAVVGPNAYVSSNGALATTIIDLNTGHITGTIPVGHIEASVYDPEQHTLWLANWNNGDMTIVDTVNNRVAKVIRKKEGGGFSMTNMISSPGGFMQLAVGPHGKNVYAASFSGNIMVYNAATNSFAKNIPVPIPMAKLSGIAVDPSGQYAYATVESGQETVSVSLKTGHIVSTAPGLLSNRWFVVSQ